MKHGSASLGVVALLVLLGTACGNSTVRTPTSQPPVVNTPITQVNDLTITSTNTFVDSYGTYHVVGEVMNNGNTVLTSIELSIEIKDASGNSLLNDDNGSITPNVITSPMLFTLAPGESSPFEYSYDTKNGTPASYNVAITSQATGEANRATLIWENVQLVEDGSGWYYLTGKLVNTGSQWAHINGLAGAVLNDNDNLLSADWTATYITELAPKGDTTGRDRTPFEINFPDPGGATKWQIFLDGDVHDNVTDYPIAVNVTNLYFDQYGSAHLVGWATNNSDQPLDSLVVAGLYIADGTVLDSSYGFIPIPMKPGAGTPFSISTFGIVDNNPTQASLVRTSSAQLDTWFTTPLSDEFVDLTATGETVLKDGATWTFNGSVTNTSGKSLNSATVVVMVMGAQNTLLAMEYTTIYPTGETISAGEANPYSVPIYLDPAADSTNFTTITQVVGNVK